MIAVSMIDLGFVVCLEFCRSVTLAIQGLFRCKDQNTVLNYEDDHPDEEREGDLQQRRRSKYSWCWLGPVIVSPASVMWWFDLSWTEVSQGRALLCHMQGSHGRGAALWDINDTGAKPFTSVSHQRCKVWSLLQRQHHHDLRKYIPTLFLMMLNLIQLWGY